MGFEFGDPRRNIPDGKVTPITAPLEAQIARVRREIQGMQAVSQAARENAEVLNQMLDEVEENSQDRRYVDFLSDELRSFELSASGIEDDTDRRLEELKALLERAEALKRGPIDPEGK